MAEYIEREAVLESQKWKRLILAFDRGMARGIIASRPAADVAPVVHGEWEHFESGWHDLWRCTSCGDEWTFEYDPTDKETMVNFCPNCGADMRERKGDDGT